MLPGGRPAKMQFFGQSHEIPQLAQLHSRHPLPVSSLLPPPGLRHAQAVSGGFKVISSADGPCSSCLFPAWRAWDLLKVPQPRSYPAFSARRGGLAMISGYPLAAGPEIPNRIHEIQVAPQLLSDQHGVSVMIVAAGLAIFVVVCLL